MGKDKIFGTLLILAGIAIAVVVVMGFSYLGETTPTILFALPGIFILLGLIIILFDFTEDHLEIDDEIEEFPELIKDDIEDLKEGRVTTTHIYLLIGFFSVASEVLLLVMYRKWLASWGLVNVFLVALIVAGIGIYLGLRSSWFQWRTYKTKPWVFFTLMFGFVVCSMLGMYYTEPGSHLPVNRDNYQYRYEDSRAGGDVTIFQSYNMGGSASNVDIDCDGDECLGLLFIVVVVICIIGSAVIPHFWVVATILLSSQMCMVSLRDLLCTPSRGWRRW